jgi:hypothetical protein
MSRTSSHDKVRSPRLPNLWDRSTLRIPARELRNRRYCRHWGYPPDCPRGEPRPLLARVIVRNWRRSPRQNKLVRGKAWPFVGLKHVICESVVGGEVEVLLNIRLRDVGILRACHCSAASGRQIRADAIHGSAVVHVLEIDAFMPGITVRCHGVDTLQLELGWCRSRNGLYDSCTARPTRDCWDGGGWLEVY